MTSSPGDDGGSRGAGPAGGAGLDRSGVRAALAIGAALLVLAGVLFALLAGSSSRSTKHSAIPSVVPSPAASASAGSGGPIDSRYLTELRFGKSSFWLQPWRAYLDPWPASRLLDAVGVNFNTTTSIAPDTARLLRDSGFRVARIERHRGAPSHTDPPQLPPEADTRSRLVARRDNGRRPLILLDANSVAPCPAKRIILTTVADAPVGASSMRLSAASAAEVGPGRTGLDAAVFHAPRRRRRHKGERLPARPRRTTAQRRQHREERRAASRRGLTPLVLSGNPGILITRVDANHVATLSRPLPVKLAAGELKATTLLYPPFSSPTRADGSPNPAFEATLAGWLGYVGTVSREAQSVFGAGGYDLEVWNELTFGSQFLNAEHYYARSSEGSTHAVTKEVTKALLAATVAYVRDPKHDISPAVGVSDGFASQTPFPSGALAPAGLTALSKHLYAGARAFPSAFRARHGNVPLDALGRRDTVGPAKSAEDLTPRFVPRRPRAS